MVLTVKQIEEVIKHRMEAELARVSAITESIDLGFNLFSLISDFYHRENLHSDIICAILDTKGKHRAGSTYLLNFISLLNLKLHQRIDHSHYSNGVEVVREVGKRDVTVLGSSNHVILIENKICDALDTPNQIPKYNRQLENQGKIVDAIVYLTLNQAKEPNESTWDVSFNEREQLRKKLVSIRAYDGTKTDLCSGWLQPCLNQTNDIDSLSILRQYLKVIKYLTRNHMDQDFMNQFDKYLKASPKNGEVVLSLNKTLQEYPKFILQNIHRHFKIESEVYPFCAIYRYTDFLYYLYDYRVAGYTFNIDIRIDSIDNAMIDFSVREESAYQKEPPEIVLTAIGMLDQFYWNGRRFNHPIVENILKFEEVIIRFITEFIDRLKQNEKAIEECLLPLKK